MENQINVGSYNDPQIGQNQINQGILTPNQIPPSQNRNNLLLILSAIAIVVVAMLIGGLFFFKNQSKTGTSVTQTENIIPERKTVVTQSITRQNITPTENNLKEKRIIAIKSSSEGVVFYTFNPVSKEKNVFLRLGRDFDVNEARVSPDGKKLYYIPSSSFETPAKIAIVDAQKSSKKIDFAKGNLWTLSSPRALIGALNNGCFWSPDSKRLACRLIEKETPNGASTGRSKISIFDDNSGNVYQVFVSDQIGTPKRARVFINLAGWLDNNNLLVVQLKQNITAQDIEPADFYSINIDRKAFTKKFSYRYEDGFKIAIAPNRNQVFFQSFSQTDEDKFIKYDLGAEQETVLASTKDVLGTTHPVVSEDGSKIVYTTYIFLKSIEEMSHIRPEELKVSGQSEIHIYDLFTNEEKTVRPREAIDYAEALLIDGTTFILNKTPDGSLLYDSETQMMSKIGGHFIGLGYF